MRQLISLSMMTALCLSLGCSTVKVKEPFGTPADAAERARHVGTWGTLGNQIQVKQNDSGELVGGVMNWDGEAEKFTVTNVDLRLTRFGDYKFVLLRGVDEPLKSEGWSFYRYERRGQDELCMYDANVQTFLTATRSGKLEGDIKEVTRVVNGKKQKAIDLRLMGLRADVETFIEEAGIEQCFSLNPIKLKLVSR